MSRFMRAGALSLAMAASLPFLPAMASPDTGRDARRTEERRGDDRRTADRAALTQATVDAAGAAAAVRAAGYGPVRSVEWERGSWEVKSSTAEGRRVELRVDAATGVVTRRDR
ncbi:PepSY domain-containing protein [Roseomonas sp. AR75]|uniref:PepSY domain-containing protein n=1 Tax=Roseomonas sp. AR75 TaxID=2562311 RepID=UPI0010C0B6FD|nr:PepSY domain-containing protein [Roseomonas sp. AR75]